MYSLLQGQWAMREPALMKDPRTREAVFHILSATMLKYKRLEGMAGPLVHLLSDHEHLPQVFADLAGFGLSIYGSDQMVRHPRSFHCHLHPISVAPHYPSSRTIALNIPRLTSPAHR